MEMTNEQMKNFIFASLTNYDYSEEYKISHEEQTKLMDNYINSGADKNWSKIFEAIENKELRERYINIFNSIDNEGN